MPCSPGRATDLVLSLGVIDGRNVWKADLNAILDRVEPVVAAGRTVILAPSCSLLHTPIDLERETDLDPEVKNWLAFAVQKVAELAMLAKALNEGRDSVRVALDAASQGCRVAPHLGRRSTIPRSRLASPPTDPSLAQQDIRFRDPAEDPARQAEAARLSDDDDRFVPADARGTQGACRSRQGHDRRCRLRWLSASRNRARRALAGRGRPRRAGPWRVRAQRHGAVFRRAAFRLRLHEACVGSVLRLALRAAADHLWRRLAAEADDGRVVALCAIADGHGR